MKDIKNIIADLQAWVEEDSENRAIALVAVQKTEETEETEEEYASDQHFVIQGIMGYLVDAFGNVLKDKDPENDLHKVLRLAIRRQALTGFLKLAERVLQNTDKKPENGSEEGKEADHE